MQKQNFSDLIQNLIHKSLFPDSSGRQPDTVNGSGFGGKSQYMSKSEATIFIYKDDDGELSLDKTNGNIRLILASEKGRVRKIGCIARNNDKKLSYYKEDEESQIFRKTDSWSINYNILSFLPSPESTINIKTEKSIYRITKAKAEQVGSFLYFKTVGIERKFYINRDHFTIEDL